MAFAHNFNVAATHVFLLCVLVVSLKTSMNASAATWSFRDEGNPVIKKYTVRDTVKITYKATIEDVVRRSLKSGYWTLNSSIILRDGGDLEIGNTTEKGKEKFWLKIRKADIRNSGLYSFMINGSVLRQWEVHVARGYEEPFSSCGRPLRRQVSHCVHHSYPYCKSFPGSPLNVNVSSHSLKGKPIIEVTWEPPTKGRNDLWGYQVHVVGKDFHAGHSQCQQINNKTGNLHSKFTKHIKYGAAYQVIVQSMPWYRSEDGADTNEVSSEIRLKDVCEIHSKSLQCCSLINVTAEYSDKKITLAWGLPLQEECRQLDIFRVRWTNLQKPKQCVGEREIKGKFNYTIHLNKECSRFNYSIKLDGGSKKAEQWSKPSKMIILIPPPELGPPSDTVPRTDNTPKILIAVFCSLLGIAFCTSLVIYRIYFQQVRLTLPDHSADLRTNGDQPLLNCDSGKRKVFILHTRCCDKCNHVVHCFGTVLRSTELIEPSIDMWNTLDISPNVPRWYEDQVKKSDCVIVLGSSKMSRRCQNPSEEGDDPLQIRCQLNFVRGNIANNPDSHRFIPAFFTCNGGKKDIPDFLSHRWSYKLPKELDRVIFRVLNVEKIQPHRFQPIVVMGGNGHPFDEKKKELDKAVQEADSFHKNNLQV